MRSDLFLLLIEQLIVGKLLDSDGNAALTAETFCYLLQSDAFHALADSNGEHLFRPQGAVERVDCAGDRNHQEREANAFNHARRQFHASAPSPFVGVAPRRERMSLAILAIPNTAVMALVM